MHFLNVYKSLTEDFENPYFAPIKASDFKNLPPTIIVTCSHDILRDQGYNYFKLLQRNGVTCYYRNYLLTLHGFLNAPEVFFRGEKLYINFIELVKEKLLAKE